MVTVLEKLFNELHKLGLDSYNPDSYTENDDYKQHRIDGDTIYQYYMIKRLSAKAESNGNQYWGYVTEESKPQLEKDVEEINNTIKSIMQTFIANEYIMLSKEEVDWVLSNVGVFELTITDVTKELDELDNFDGFDL